MPGAPLWTGEPRPSDDFGKMQTAMRELLNSGSDLGVPETGPAINFYKQKVGIFRCLARRFLDTFNSNDQIGLSSTVVTALLLFFWVTLRPDELSAVTGADPAGITIFTAPFCGSICEMTAERLEAWLKGTRRTSMDRNDLIQLLRATSSATSGVIVTMLHKLVLNMLRHTAKNHWKTVFESTNGVRRELERVGPAGLPLLVKHFATRLQKYLDLFPRYLYGDAWEHLAETTSYWLKRLNAPPTEHDPGWSTAMKGLVWTGEERLYRTPEDPGLFFHRLEAVRRLDAGTTRDQLERLLDRADVAVTQVSDSKDAGMDFLELATRIYVQETGVATVNDLWARSCAELLSQQSHELQSSEVATHGQPGEGPGQ